MRILRRLRFRRRVRFFFHLARILAAALCCGVEERGGGRSMFAGFQRNAGEKRNCPPHAGVLFGSVGHRPAWLRHRESRQVRPRAPSELPRRGQRAARFTESSRRGARAPSSRQSDRRASSTPLVSAVRHRALLFLASSRRCASRRSRLLRRLLRAIPSVGFHDLPSTVFPLARFAPPRLSSSTPWVSPSATC